MAAASHKFVTRVGDAGANLRPTNGAVVQNGRLNNGGPIDAGGTTNKARTCGEAGEHVYDELNFGAARADSELNQYAPLSAPPETEQNQYAPLSAPPESEQNQYAPLNDYQTCDNNIYTKLDSLEHNQRHLAEQFQDSQQRILSELSQVKDLVKTLSDLVKTLSDLVKKSLTTAQKTSAEQEQRVQELAANLGQEVFHIGQEVMSTIRERNDEDMARQTWRQEMETDRRSSLSRENNKLSKRKNLPSL
ncbi:hypothetical protein BsWGS_08631 [Bradybaena similaris]